MKDVACSLTIAGTDPTGGAGIQADLKTFQELQSYGMSVITSVLAQNTTGVQDIHHVPLSTIEQQLDSVFSDMPVHALKTGMIANIDMMEIIREKIADRRIPYVIDPVMVATSGDALISHDARDYLKEHLLPQCTVVTPNLAEAAFLVGRDIHNELDMIGAAKTIVHDYGAGAALITGGHLEGDASDLLYDGRDTYTLSVKRINTNNTHGTGCTFSAAITAYLSHGLNLVEAIERGKQFVTAAIDQSFDLGAGSGPTNHWAIRDTAQHSKGVKVNVR